MRTIVLTAAAMALLVGCKKKPTEPNGGSAQGSAGTATPALPSPAPATPTAEGSAVAALPVVTDCPKSLTGTEKVARTIKKACGPITVIGSLTIEGSLTLEAGVVLKFQPDAELVIGYNGPAKLIVQGGDAPDQRVVFTSAGDQAAGVWKGVTLHDGADRSVITGLDIEYAGQANAAALTLRDATDVAYTKSSIKHAKDLGLSTQGSAAFAQFATNTFDDIGKVAASFEPSAVANLGTGNTFGKGAFVEIRGGHLDGDATWKNIGAPYHVTGQVYVDAASTPITLSISDAQLAFASGVELSIGYNKAAKLRVTGPATFTGIDGAPGSWTGVVIYGEGDATIENATFANGGSVTGGVLTAKSTAKLALGEVAFKDNKVGLWVDDQATLTAPKPLTFSGNEHAAHLTTAGLGALSGGNVYAENQIIELAGGRLRDDTTWQPQAKAIVQVTAEVDVDGYALTINGGGVYQWKTDTVLNVGYNKPGTLKVLGRADAPVVFGALTGGTWNGVTLYDGARGVELSYLSLADVNGDAGIIAKADAVGKLDHVSCTHCAATVAPACKAKLDTHSAVTAGAATKIAIKPPTGC